MITENTERSAFIEQNLGWCIPAPGASGAEASNTTTCTARAAWGWSRLTMPLTRRGASAFPPTRCRSSSARSRSCSGMGHSQGEPLPKGTEPAGQRGAGTSPQALWHRAHPFPTGRGAGGERGEHHAGRTGCPAHHQPDPGEPDEPDRQIDIPVESPEEALADRIGLAEVLEKLPEEDQLLIRLRFYGGKTQSETAKLLHTTQVQISRRNASCSSSCGQNCWKSKKIGFS